MTETSSTAAARTPSWSTAADIWRVVVHRPHLRRTLLTALIVGTVLFAINQLDVVLSGAATVGTWIKAAVTYLVPFAVANVGVLVASRRPADAEQPDSRRRPSPDATAAPAPTGNRRARRRP